VGVIFSAGSIFSMRSLVLNLIELVTIIDVSVHMNEDQVAEAETAG
jgi:hypothetical protein